MNSPTYMVESRVLILNVNDHHSIKLITQSFDDLHEQTYHLTIFLLADGVDLAKQIKALSLPKSSNYSFKTCVTAIERRNIDKMTFQKQFPFIEISSLAQLASLCKQANWCFNELHYMPPKMIIKNTPILFTFQGGYSSNEANDDLTSRNNLSFEEFCDLLLTFASFDFPVSVVFHHQFSDAFLISLDEKYASWQKIIKSFKVIYDINEIYLYSAKFEHHSQATLADDYIADVDGLFFNNRSYQQYQKGFDKIINW